MSKAPRGKSFTTSELESLLEIIEDILPVGPNEWEAVLARHVTRYPDMERTKESIKRKFSSLYNAKKPTGDPTCPPTVRSAKRIYNMIKEKMDFSDGESGFDEEEEEGNEEELDGNGSQVMETPSGDANVPNSNVGSSGSDMNSVKPFKMLTSSSGKRKTTAGARQEETFDSFVMAMLLKSEKEAELQAARHREKMEIMERQQKLEEMKMERKERIEEMKAERQDKWMQMMMMHMMQSSSSASKKQKTQLELPDDNDSE